MDIFIMYSLMIIDLTWTLMHHEMAEELNPIFANLLMGREVVFIYVKLAANTAAAFIIIYLRKKRPILSRLLALFGIVVYTIVVFLHWFVDYVASHGDEIHNNPLWQYLKNF